METASSLMREELNTMKQSRPLTLIDRILLLVMFAAIEVAFVNPGLSTVVGPVIALLLVYTYFIMRETVLVTTIIVMANDALGTMFFDKISFQYLLIFFVVIELFSFKKITIRTLCMVCLAVFLCSQLVFFGNIDFRQAAWAILYTVAFIVQYAKYQSDREGFFDKLCFSFAVILSLISIHVLITGGVEYYELDNNSQEFIRRGVLGAGNGDSNFSSLYLCTGIIGALNCTQLGRNIKIVMVSLMMAAMSVTLSVTGLVSLIGIFIYHFATKKKGIKSLLIIILVIAIMVALFSAYTHLPDNYHVEAVDEYISRITEKLDLFSESDVDTATSGRSRILRRYLNYIVYEQPLWNGLFGGNGIMLTGGVPHNTFVDWLLQVGWIGFAVMLCIIVRRFWLSGHLPPNIGYKKMLIMMKCLLLIFCFSLSIYDGASYGVLFFFLFFL